jgi:hypothetical protein
VTVARSPQDKAGFRMGAAGRATGARAFSGRFKAYTFLPPSTTRIGTIDPIKPCDCRYAAP